MDTLQKLDDLEELINSGELIKETKFVREWGGADVIISNRMTPRCKHFIENQPFVISLQSTAP